MPRLNELQLQDTVIEEGQMASLDDMQESGSFLPMLQPGVYTFELPGNVDEVYSLVDERQADWKPESQGTQYLKASFDEQHPLKIVDAQMPAHKLRVGEPVRERVTNVPRDWKIGGVSTKVKDMLYLLKKLGHKVVPKTNREYITALNGYAGKPFKAAIGVSWNCSAKRKARFWVVDAANPSGHEVESGAPGCGEKYYPDKHIAKDATGMYPEKVQCKKCSAIVRGFSNLDLLKEA